MTYTHETYIADVVAPSTAQNMARLPWGSENLIELLICP